MFELYQGDCLEVMGQIPSASVDMVLCDLPYGTTACTWDSVIPFNLLWGRYEKLLKSNGSVILTASQPFTTALIASNYEWFKYALVWEKSRATGHVHAKNKPMKKHEDILVFSLGNTGHSSQSANRMVYNPQGLSKLQNPRLRKEGGSSNAVMSKRPSHKDTIQEVTGYPTSVLRFTSEGSTVHPTQKPVALLEYLIKTYTNPGDVVLDNTMGSGSTGVACANTGRRFIGIEKDEKYFQIAKKRVEEAYANSIF